MEVISKQSHCKSASEKEEEMLLMTFFRKLIPLSPMTPLFPRPIIIPFSPIMPLLPKPIIIPLSASVTNRFIPLTGRGISTFNKKHYLRNIMNDDDDNIIMQ